jgi:hypothetical protein
MPEAGHSWQKTFDATTEAARHARTWVASRLNHPDAEQLAAELFVSVLISRPAAIQMTVSTAGIRTRITASGGKPLPMLSVHGPASEVIRGLALLTGSTPDDCGLWVEISHDPNATQAPTGADTGSSP